MFILFKDGKAFFDTKNIDICVIDDWSEENVYSLVVLQMAYDKRVALKKYDNIEDAKRALETILRATVYNNIEEGMVYDLDAGSFRYMGA